MMVTWPLSAMRLLRLLRLTLARELLVLRRHPLSPGTLGLALPGQLARQELWA